MTAILEETSTTNTEPTAGDQLRSSMAAMKVSFHWIGTRKALSSEQIVRAADAFEAERKFLTAGKKLFDTSDPSFRQVTAVKTTTMNYFKSISLPFPEPGVRLIRQDQIDVIHSRMTELRDELANAVRLLEDRFADLTAEARDRLGNLFDPADYPSSLEGAFQVDWSFPTVSAPDYLRRLNPELYEQECQRVRSRFDEAVRLAEHSFVEELGKLIDHLSERLSGADDGKVKVFRDSAVTNFNEFFERFQSLNVGSNSEIDSLVDRARQIVSGVAPNTLRTSGDLRDRISNQLSSVQASLDGMMVDRPRRNIIR